MCGDLFSWTCLFLNIHLSWPRHVYRIVSDMYWMLRTKYLFLCRNHFVISLFLDILIVILCTSSDMYADKKSMCVDAFIWPFCVHIFNSSFCMLLRVVLYGPFTCIWHSWLFQQICISPPSFDQYLVGTFPRLFCIEALSLFVSDNNAEDFWWLAKQRWSICREARVPQPHRVRVRGQTGRVHAEGQAEPQRREGQLGKTGVAGPLPPGHGPEQDWQVGCMTSRRIHIRLKAVAYTQVASSHFILKVAVSWDVSPCSMVGVWEIFHLSTRLHGATS
jgi:hypothetical protein